MKLDGTLIAFTYDTEDGKVDIHVLVDHKSEFWFCLHDISDILEDLNSDKITKELQESEKLNIPYPYTDEEFTTFVSEFGLYTIVLKNNNSKVKAFRDWIVHEINECSKDLKGVIVYEQS